MRRLALCCCLAVLVACSKSKDQPAKDVMEDAAPAPAEPAPISLADVAGKWNVKVTPEGGDSAILSFEMVATADSTGWTFNFPKRPPVPIRIVAVDGDSIVTEAGPYESALRKGVQVTTHNVNRLQGGNLVGTTTARYKTSRPDSVISLRFEGTRAQ